MYQTRALFERLFDRVGVTSRQVDSLNASHSPSDGSDASDKSAGEGTGEDVSQSDTADDEYGNGVGLLRAAETAPEYDQPIMPSEFASALTGLRSTAHFMDFDMRITIPSAEHITVRCWTERPNDTDRELYLELTIDEFSVYASESRWENACDGTAPDILGLAGTYYVDLNHELEEAFTPTKQSRTTTLFHELQSYDPGVDRAVYTARITTVRAWDTTDAVTATS